MEIEVVVWDAGVGSVAEPVEVWDAGEGFVGELHEATNDVMLPPARVSPASLCKMVRRDILCSAVSRPSGPTSCENES